MSTTVFNDYTAVATRARAIGAAVSVDLLSRALGNLAHNYKRITGEDLPGFGVNTVAGHGHSGGADGVVMPRLLASSTSRARAAATEESNNLLVAAEPLIAVWTGVSNDEPSGRYKLPLLNGDMLPLLTTPDLDRTECQRISPMYRRILVPPGCTRVGARITFIAAATTVAPDDTVAPAPSFAFRLTSALSSAVVGNVTGLPGATYTADRFGDRLFYNPVNSAAQIYYDDSKHQWRNIPVATWAPQEAWLGLPARPQRGQSVVAAVKTPAGNRLLASRGAVEVRPGEYNDIDIEFAYTTFRSVLFVYSVHLYAIP